MKKLLILLPLLLAGTGEKYPLHEAVRRQDLKAVELLLKEYAAGAQDGLGRTPLHIAAMADWVPGIQLLRARGVPVNAVDMDGRTPLHLAAAQGATAATRLLLAHGGHMEVRDQAGKTPLHAAAEAGHVQAGQALIECGADVNAVHNRYQTPLHYAAKNGHLEMTFLLLARGADSTARDTDEHTPLDKALQRHQDDVAALLSNGTRPSILQDGPRRPPKGKQQPRLVGLTAEPAGATEQRSTDAPSAAPPERPAAAADEKPADEKTVVATEKPVAAADEKPVQEATAAQQPQGTHDEVYDLAAVLPPRCLFYAGWSGDEARVRLPETAMDKLLAEPQVRQATLLLWAQVQGMAREALESRNAGSLYEPLNAFLELLWRKPSAITILDLKVTPGGGDIQAAFLVRTASDSEQFIGLFEQLLQSAGLPPAVAGQSPDSGRAYKRLKLAPTLPPVVYQAVDGFVVIALGDAAFESVVAALQEGPHLIEHPQFAAARRNMRVDTEDVLFSGYINVAGLVQGLQDSLPGMVGAPLADKEVIDRFLDASGLDGLKTFALATAVQEGGYRRTAFLSVAEPKKGLFKLADQAPVQDDDLRVVPRQAQFAAVFNFDLARAYEEVLFIADQLTGNAGNAGPAGDPGAGGGAQPGVGQMLRSAMGTLEQRMGCSLKEDLLDPLGDTFVLFDAATSDETVPGWTLVAEVKDVDKLEHALQKIIDALQSSRDGAPLELGSATHNDHEVHFVQAPSDSTPLAPAWSIDSGRLIAGLSPQIVGQAWDLVDANDPHHSLLANSDFQRGRHLLPEGASSVTYLDTRKSVGVLTEKALPFIQMMSAMSGGQGAGTDTPGLPSTDVLTRHLFGDVAASAALEDGILWVSHGPLPMAPPGAVDTSQLAQLAGLMSTAGDQVPPVTGVALTPLPTDAALTPPPTGVALTPLELINVACEEFAYSHGGAFPPDLETLVQMKLLPEQLLDAAGDSGQSPYGYVPGQTFDNAPGNILLYHRSEDGRELTVLFVDGHVEILDALQFARLMQQTSEQIEPPLRAVPAAGRADE